eukprot:362054-Chlamydomonas_euryale.AAC.3
MAWDSWRQTGCSDGPACRSGTCCDVHGRITAVWRWAAPASLHAIKTCVFFHVCMCMPPSLHSCMQHVCMHTSACQPCLSPASMCLHASPAFHMHACDYMQKSAWHACSLSVHVHPQACT